MKLRDIAFASAVFLCAAVSAVALFFGAASYFEEPDDSLQVEVADLSGRTFDLVALSEEREKLDVATAERIDTLQDEIDELRGDVLGLDQYNVDAEVAGAEWLAGLDAEGEKMWGNIAELWGHVEELWEAIEEIFYWLGDGDDGAEAYEDGESY